MGEGRGKASKAQIYLESILSPSQAVKSLIALVICTKHFDCSGEFLGKIELFSSGFRRNPNILLTLQQPLAQAWITVLFIIS